MKRDHGMAIRAREAGPADAEPAAPGSPARHWGHRLRPDAGVTARLAIAGGRPTRVLELGLHGAVLEAGAQPRPAAGRRSRLAIFVEGQERVVLPAELVEAEEGAREWVLRFVEPTLQAARAVIGIARAAAEPGVVATRLPDPAYHEVIDTPEGVRSALRGLVALEAPARLVEGADRPAPLRLAGAAAGLAGPVLLWRPEGPAFPLSGEGPVTLVVEGYNSLHTMTVEPVDRGPDGVLHTTLPDRIVRTRYRWYRRAAAPEGLRVRFRHPDWDELALDHAVIDVSHFGCGIAGDAVRDVLSPGMFLGEVRLAWKGHELLRAGAWVRNLRPLDDGREIFGLQFAPIGDAASGEFDAWHAFVDDLLSPRVRVGAPWSEEAWELFDASGYFNLSGRSTKDFARLRKAYVEASHKLAQAPRQGIIAAWPVEEGLGGSLTLLRVYPRTWMACQLAKRPSSEIPGVHGGMVIRDIAFRVYEHAMKSPDLRWLLAYIHEGPRFTRVIHHDFPLRFIDRGEAHVQKVHAVQVSSRFRAARPGRGVEIGLANPDEMRRIGRLLERIRVPAYREALSLDPEDLDLADYLAEVQGDGLVRGRVFFVLRRQGRARSFAIAEVGEEGLHLFGLLDGVRIFGFHGRPPREEVELLLEAAADWYQVFDKQRFILFDEDELCDPDWSAHLVDLGRADLVLLSAKRLPELMEKLCEVTAPRRLLSEGGGSGGPGGAAGRSDERG